MQIGAQTTGLREFAEGLRGFERRLMGELNRADHEARRLVVKRLQSSMDSGGWAPNAEAYRRWKVAHGHDGRPLLRTHLLRDSISGERITFSPALIHSRVGWPGGATYSGGTRGARRVTGKRQRGRLGSAGGSNPELEAVARWLEEGSRGPKRPFINRTRRDVRSLVVQQFRAALARSVAGIGGRR